MPYGECKIYSDGSHFIAIPHTTRPYRKRKKPPEEEITVAETQENTAEGSTFPDNGDVPVPLAENFREQVPEQTANTPQIAKNTRKQNVKRQEKTCSRNCINPI